MTDRPRILIGEPDRFHPEAQAVLAALGEVVLAPIPPGGLGPALHTADILWIRLGHRLTAEMLAVPVRCRLLATPVTGLDHLDLAACADTGLQVVSLRGETAFLRTIRATAELTLGLVLALVRHLVPAASHVEAGGWDRDLFQGRDLYGRTAGVIGLGRLGTIMADYYRALGMHVIGYDPRPDVPREVDLRPSIEGVLAEADVISLHVSYDASTHHLIDAPRLAAVKPGAVLVNTSRGGIVDEAALLDALTSGRLAGAALDVLQGEPDTAANPLVAYARTHDHLLIVPHLGGNTQEAWVKTQVFLAHKVVKTWKEGLQ